MKITDEAKSVLQNTMKENNLDGLRVVIQETCCGKSPVVGFDTYAQDETPEIINEIPVVIEEDAKEDIENVVIDLVNGELALLNTVCSCSGGCSGCHEE